MSQLLQPISSAICTPHPGCKLLPYILHDLTRMESHPSLLTEAAYEWCSLICENYSGLVNGEKLLLLALEAGFRHLDPRGGQILAKLTHTEHHTKLVDIVFGSGDTEAIADLLQAWTSRSSSHQPPTSFKRCAGYLINLFLHAPSPYYCAPSPSPYYRAPSPYHCAPSPYHHAPSPYHPASSYYRAPSPYHRAPSPYRSVDPPHSQRLRKLVIYAIELIGFQEFEQVGVREFCGLLDTLHVSTKDIGSKENWARLLLDAIQSPQGAQYLPHPYWELLAEFSTSDQQWGRQATVTNASFAHQDFTNLSKHLRHKEEEEAASISPN